MKTLGWTERQDEGSTPRGSVLQTLIALVIILVAFRVADVSPVRAESPAANPEAPYVSWIRAVDEALVRRDAGAAARAWREAYSAGLASPGWEGLLTAGDAARRIAEIAGPRLGAEAKARTAYLAAFYRARHAGNVGGMLRAADAFAALGDYEVAGAVPARGGRAGRARDRRKRRTGARSRGARRRGPGPGARPGAEVTDAPGARGAWEGR